MIVYFINNFTKKYIQLLFSLICGIFGMFAFAPYNFWPGSIIALTRLLVLILNVKYKKIIWHTLLWGIGFFGTGLNWIYIGINQFINAYHYINIFLIILLTLYLTCYPILFSISCIILRSSITKWSLIGLAPILWSIVERLRGNTIIGFPWLQFGYSQIDGPIKGIAPILGVEGITFILVFISSLLALSITMMQLLPFAISIILLILITPLSSINWYHIKPNSLINVALVQGNIDQYFYWDPSNIESILKIYLQHTLPILEKTHIIIWPETAIPGNEIMHNKFLVELDYQLKKHHTCLITGIIDTKFTKNSYEHYNSIIVLGNADSYTYSNCNRYNKHHLVLCAESFPCKRFLKKLSYYLNIPITVINPGNYFQPQLQTHNIKMTAAICYEIILGSQIRNNFKPDTDFLLTIANDIWFGNSAGPWQHFQMVRMRALELGRPILCGTNNGITAVINANGTIKSQIPQFISSVLNTDIMSTTGTTPYAKFGSWWLFGIIIIFLIHLTIFKKKIKNIL